MIRVGFFFLTDLTVSESLDNEGVYKILFRNYNDHSHYQNLETYTQSLHIYVFNKSDSIRNVAFDIFEGRQS